MGGPAGALSGIRVLDLSRILSGPYATMILADLGADVVKVEDTKDGDDSRQWGPPFQGDDASYFLAVNRNKRDICIDLKSPEGLAVVMDLVEQADVVVENFRPGTAARLGVGYEALSERNPRIVYASISGYGQTGPWAARPGYDAVAQAESGMMSVCGEPGGAPMRPGVATADIGAGMWATIGILAALREREASGRGQHVDVSLLEGQLAWLTYVAGGYFTTGRNPEPHGSAHPTIVPYQALRASDGHVMVACGNDRLWRRFAALLGDDGLADDDRYASNADRVENRDELVARIERSFGERASAHWLRVLEDAGIPCAPIASVEGALGSPQAQARHVVQEIEHPTAGTLKTIASPIRLSATPTLVRSAPPLLGQDTDDVLAELGRSPDEIDALRGTGSGPVNPVTVTRDGGGVARVDLGTGRRANALGEGGWRELGEAVAGLAADDTVRAVIFRGADGASFSSGSDLREWADASPDAVEASFGAIEAALVAIERLPVPTVAAVRGVATGAGCQLACACDLRVVAPDAALGMPVARWGILVPPTFVARLAGLTGLAVARELLYTGRLVRGSEAQRIGLASLLADGGDVEARTSLLLEEILAHPDAAVRAVKRATVDIGESERATVRTLLAGPSADYPTLHRGVAAFLGR